MSKTVVAVAPELELPELPEGFFWRFSNFGFHIDQLELRKKFLFFSYRVSQYVIPFYALDEDGKRMGINDPKEVIEHAAIPMAFGLTTGLPEASAPRRSTPAYIPLNKEITFLTLDSFERSFEAQYEQYRRASL